MTNFSLYIIDITQAGGTNGVDRYISCLLKGLETVSHIKLYHIQLCLRTADIRIKRTEEARYTRITVPLPEQAGNVINKLYWSKKYCEKAFRLISPDFEGDEKKLLHIHTLNLIDLALEIKRQTGAKIITHLHCIPWKSLFNEDEELFNCLYRLYYLKQKYDSDFYTCQSEERAYTSCDKLIACTRCGQQFVQNVTGVPPEKTALIHNGIPDLNSAGPTGDAGENPAVRILFVGSVVAGKGIFFILEALRRVVGAGYNILFHVAGQGPQNNFIRMAETYPEIPMQLLGDLPFDRLQELYRTCDIGIIGSIQEQNSYVAIEMAMFGLPVITTAVDGLDEMFTDRANALKIPVAFHPLKGLAVDTERMKERIVELITHPEIRQSLSVAGRRLFEREYTTAQMIDRLLPVYESVLNESHPISQTRQHAT